MKNILVPTDLSINSKAGIKFAIQWASQNKAYLTFYHHTRLLKPTRWTEQKYQSYVIAELEATEIKLRDFVKAIYKKAGIVNPKYQHVVRNGMDVQQSIIDYAVEAGADVICMGTRGAGRLKKMMGTHASGIIKASPIPVFVIPKDYRRRPVTHIFYASDFENLAPELKRVRDFARPVKAKISVYHYDYLMGTPGARTELSKMIRRYNDKDLKFHLQKLDPELPFAPQLMRDVRKAKPSLVAVFTNQNRDWFDKLFLPSKSADLVFDAKVPLLVFSQDQ